MAVTLYPAPDLTMPTDPAITRILNRTPLYKKVSVSKVFDFAEEVNAALTSTGHTADWLANELGITLESLTDLLSGMDPFYDPIARIEAAFKMDLMVGATQCKRYFGNVISFNEESTAPNVDSCDQIDMVVRVGTEFDMFCGVRWHKEETPRQRTVSADISAYFNEKWDNMPTVNNLFPNG